MKFTNDFVRRLPAGAPGFVRLLLLTACIAALPCAARGDAAPAPLTVKSQDVLNELSAIIDWNRSINAVDSSPVSAEDALFRDASRHQSIQAVRMAFTAARGQAALVADPTTKPTATDSSALAKAARQAADHVTQLQSQMRALEAEVQAAPPTSQPVLSQRRDLLQAELMFARQQQTTIEALVGYIGSVDNNGQGGSLLDNISQLESSTPGALSTDAATQPSSDASGADTFEKPESSGIIGLATSLFSMTRKMSTLHHLSDYTQKLIDHNDSLRNPLRTALLDTTKRGNALSATTQSDDPSRTASTVKSYNDLTARYYAITGALVPLREESALLAATKASLLDWHASVLRAYEATARYLLIRVGIIVALLVALGGMSVLWKRATFRYIGDVRRRRQFLVVRRIVVLAIAAAIFVGGFVSEFGSLATYAGLLTAGLAVALQTVIVSGFAYFFFVGRYGVRVGDRITIGNVTGDVIDVGLFRLYMMELAGADRDLRPSGRVVVFSNSVLLQPQPFFKLLPGSDYVWHQVALTLSPDSDYAMAERKFLEAIDSVFKGYRDVIHQQWVTVTRSSHLTLPEPKPEHWLRFVDAGLEFVVRYPVEIERASEVDDRITRQLLATIESTPTLRLVAAGTPKIQSANPTPPCP